MKMMMKAMVTMFLVVFCSSAVAGIVTVGPSCLARGRFSCMWIFGSALVLGVALAAAAAQGHQTEAEAVTRLTLSPQFRWSFVPPR